MEKVGMRYQGLATYYDMPGLKKYVAERDQWKIPAGIMRPARISVRRGTSP
jgi:hypothetical protein